jgi:predicted nucleic acid-binding protein
MEITVRIPDDLARRLGTAGEVERRALEALALEEFKLGHLNRSELRRLPGFVTADAPVAYRNASLADLHSLVIAIDPGTNRHAWSATRRLWDRFGLTPYDAAYLELALRRQLPLATLDGDLIRAAQAENVTLIGIHLRQAQRDVRQTEITRRRAAQGEPA